VDEAEFTEWAAGHQRQLLRSAYLLTGDVHRAEDLVQEALVKVALRWSRLREGSPVAALVVQRSLARLARRQRAVLVLRHFDDLTERETAEILGITVGSVKSTNASALARLRDGAPELLDLIGEAR
jgi:DNA-directed RNA polymerase specialized sigma24 family protein